MWLEKEISKGKEIGSHFNRKWFISLHEKIRANTQRGNSLRGKDADRSQRKSRDKVVTYAGLLVAVVQCEKTSGGYFHNYRKQPQCEDFII